MPLDLATMTEEEAVEELPKLVRQYDELRHEARIVERRATAIRMMIEAVAEVFPDLEDLLPPSLTDETEGGHPRGSVAVLRVLDEKPGTGYTVEGIVKLLNERGWMPNSSNPSNAIRTAAERLVDQKRIRKFARDGRVFYQSQVPEEEPF